jgi:Glycosyl transferase family 11
MLPANFVGIKISGGLGNQLFQYAAGLALARRLGADLYCNLRPFDDRRERPLELGAFGIKPKDWRPTWWKVERLARRVSGGRWRPGPERLEEKAPFEPNFFTIRPPCYLKGYYQNPRYFDSIADELRALYDTDRLSTARTAPLQTRILASPCPVAVHVRRGDYTKQAALFRNLARDHYDRARAELAVDGTEPTFFLFSDDGAAALVLLDGWPNIVPVTGFSALEDFRLMSLCRHFLIANSTFSWWAAWLGRSPDKQVIAPASWYGPDYWWQMPPTEWLLPPKWVAV